jgi:glycosyltransferase involved in cell wall biosynthesis
MDNQHPIQVAMVIWSYWPGHEGGAEKQCRKLIPSLGAEQVSCRVVTARTSRSRKRREWDGDCQLVRLGWSLPVWESIATWTDRMIGRCFRGSHQKARRSARLREALSFWGKLPWVFLARLDFLICLRRWLSEEETRPDLLHVHESSWLAGATRLLAEKHGIPVLAKTANFPALNRLGYDVPFRGRIARARTRCQFVAMAPFLRQSLVEDGIPPDHIYLVPNGVAVPELSSEPAPNPEVLFVGNFSQGVEHKAFDLLLDAWCEVVRDVPEASLHLLGDGEVMPWRHYADRLGIQDSVHFHGWVPDPSVYFKRAHLFVMPSRTEGMSNALLEAQSWGVPCLVSNIPANRPLVEDGQTGELFELDNPRALAEQAVALLKDPQRSTGLGQGGREQIQAHYALDVVARQMKVVYETILMKEQE